MAEGLPGESSIGIELNRASKNTLCFLVLFRRPKSPPKAREKSRIIRPGRDLLTKESCGFGVSFIGFFGVVDPRVKFSETAIAFRVRGVSFKQLPYFADFPGSIGLGFQHGEAFLRIQAETCFQRNGGQFEKFAQAFNPWFRRGGPGAKRGQRQKREPGAKTPNRGAHQTRYCIRNDGNFKKKPCFWGFLSRDVETERTSNSQALGLRTLFHLLPIFFCAFGANSVSEFSMSAVADVNFNLGPVALVISNFLAAGANRQQAAQQLHLGERCL